MSNKNNDSYSNKTCNCNETILLACKNGISIGPINNIATMTTTPISLGSITVNTKDLCNSSIIVTFTGEISSAAIPLPNTSFRIVKTCNDSNSEIVRTFTLGEVPLLFVTESFSFSYCDDDFCCDCISYSLEVITGPLSAGTNLVIKNVVISAKAINHNPICDDCPKVFSKCNSTILTPTINIREPSQLFLPITIGSITINPKDLCDPKVLLDFSGVVSAVPIGLNFLTFRVSRTCNNITTQVSGTLGSSISLLFNDEFFSYQICDCLDCIDCDCITYTIELIPDFVIGPISILNFLISIYSIENDSSLFNCSKGNKISFVSSASDATPITMQPLSVGNISVNLSKSYEPTVLITFTGDIAAIGITTGIDTFFRVTRTCNCIKTQNISDFSALSLLPGAAFPLTSESFSYQICDNNIPCNCDCITYTIEFLSRNPILPTTTFLIDNVVISAFLKENC